jgi:hypothetical protein
MDEIEQKVTEMMKLDEENGADTRLEDDQVMEVINVAKDDLLMVDRSEGLEKTKCTCPILRIQHTHHCLDQT